MELYKELLVNVLEKQKVEVSFPSLTIDAEKIIELECYKALMKIKEVIDDYRLEDKECFERIENIICIFEDTCGSKTCRHDF